MEIDRLFYLAFWLTGVCFLVIAGVLIYFLIKYRARKGHSAYYTHGSSKQALLFTLALALAVFVLIDVNLAYHDHLAWEKIWSVPKDLSNAVRVEIGPKQFEWHFRLAGADGKFKTEDDILSVNELHIPVHTPIIVALSSRDVIHSFFLPNFRIKQDAVPGIVTNLYFKADKPGTYDIACAEHCGLGHYRMRGWLVVESQDEFNQWLTEPLEETEPTAEWGWEWGARVV